MFPFRASNSPFHVLHTPSRRTFSTFVNPRASPYYSINNQLRLIFSPPWHRLSSFHELIGNIIIREMDHTSNVNRTSAMKWWVRDEASWYFGWRLLQTMRESLFFFDMPSASSDDEVKIIENESKFRLLCGDGNNNNQTVHHHMAMTFWIANLIYSWSHGSISFIPHVRRASVLSKRSRTEMEIEGRTNDKKIGSFYYQPV